MERWRLRAWMLVVAALVAAATGAARSTPPPAWQTPPPQTAAPQEPVPSLPTALSGDEFWQLSTALSEPGGTFRSENLVSNEQTYQYVIPLLKATVKPGGVYLGVAPDQNFTYIAAVRPRMAFILDIRRGNLLEHLMYKALFEMSVDRADFVSRLFSRPRPASLKPTASVLELFSAYARVPTSESLYKANVAAMKAWLIQKRRLPLTAEDWEQLESIYYAFYWDGPGLRYTSAPAGMAGFRGGGGGGFGPGGRFPSYEELIVQTDFDGVSRSYLASEDNFRFVKSLEEKNLIVPVVGNFAGPRALRSIGRYVRERRSAIAAFYVSNVEQYLFQDRLFDDFARNVAALPITGDSTFIRSVSSRFGYGGGMTWSDGRATALYPIGQFVRDFQLGLLTSYYDVNQRSR
jgi:hypothetical protein